ncbi:MAG: alpha/beta hydrolase [Hyphomicrobiales bacterium]|nr:alpha/beta hydrolase [Hyphomicrobiales bacterium]MCP4999965.1 alpha/beta hydrolase [Hyphomicrobiales bacterium]
MSIQRNSFRTSDGITLSYLQHGIGRPLIMLPGWSQTANGFTHQLKEFGALRTAIAVDLRGHGESEKPQSGYRKFRFAQDLLDMIDALEIDEFDLLGHSMDVSVIFAYITLFADQRAPQNLVLVDEPPAVLARANWTQTECQNAGTLLASLDDLANFRSSVLKATTPALHAEIIRPMVTSAIDENTLLDLATENLKLPRDHAAVLLEDNCLQDWRLTIPTIRQPTLVISGEASQVPTSSQIWMAEQIAGAQFKLISESERGSHFMFLENPSRFNQVVLDFLTAN